MDRSHGTVEDAARIDSFDLSFAETDEIFCSGFWLEVDKLLGGDDDRAIVSYRGNLLDDGLTITMTDSTPPQQFWRCPRCRRRARFVYWTGRNGFRCRRCAGLNYKRQQETRDTIQVWEDAMAFAREKLRWMVEPGECNPIDLPYTTPPRPKRMHQNTYDKHLRRWARFQKEYRKVYKREIEKILAEEIRKGDIVL